MDQNEISQESGEAKPKRRIRNFLLQPLIQTKIGVYSILMACLFTVVLIFILYQNFSGLINAIVLLTDAEEEVRELFWDYWRGTQIWIYLAFLVYLVATVIMSILYTHKLVGPTIAFRRHIRSIAEGQLGIRTYLRRGDAFREVADELNHLSDTLQKKRSYQPLMNQILGVEMIHD